MKKLMVLLILSYYSIGSILLPLGDFGIIPHLPKMYMHCKTHEHLDMTLVDFITDHLLNIDSVFDDHRLGDDQKAHKPFKDQQNSTIQILFCYIFPICEFIKSDYLICFDNTIFNNNIFLKSYDYNESILRPPIC